MTSPVSNFSGAGREGLATAEDLRVMRESRLQAPSSSPFQGPRWRSARSPPSLLEPLGTRFGSPLRLRAR